MKRSPLASARIWLFVTFAVVNLVTAEPTTAQLLRTTPEQCAHVENVARRLLELVGESASPSNFRTFVEAFVGADKSCSGPKELRPGSYRDYALLNALVRTVKTREPLVDLIAAGMTIVEPMVNSTTARILPFGLGPLGSLLSEDRTLSEEDYKRTPLRYWGLPYVNYSALRTKRFGHRHILSAVEDLWTQGDSLSDMKSLENMAIVNRDGSAGRDRRNCLYIRLGTLARTDVEQQRLGSQYRLATTQAEKDRILALIDARGEALDKLAKCK